MAERVCPGLAADWLNAWLAAVGSTVLDDRIQLHWTPEPVPLAVLSVDGDDDPADVLIAAWPNRERLAAMPVACECPGLPRMGRKVHVDVFRERVRAARSHSDSWTLSSTVTDLHVDDDGEASHAPLDPPGPGPTGSLHDRLLKSHKHVDSPPEQVLATLEGRASRVVDNGLGFDLARVTGQADKSQKTVDPAVEVLAFFGLALLPVRGDGTDQRMPGARSRTSTRQRGWRTTPPRRFEWPAWLQPLDREGIDALLDAWHDSLPPMHRPGPDEERAAPKHNRAPWERLGVHAAWRTVGYQSRSRSDPTRGYGSEPL